MAHRKLGASHVSDGSRRRVRSPARWPAVLGALSVGLLLAICVDVFVRWLCPPSFGAPFPKYYRPRGSVVEVIAIDDWDRPLAGMASQSWAWTDVRLSDDYREMLVHYGARSSDSAHFLRGVELTRRYRARPNSESPAELCATRFGFPFRSSVREVLWGVVPAEAASVGDVAYALSDEMEVEVTSLRKWVSDPQRIRREDTGDWSRSQRDFVRPLALLGNTIFFGAAALLLAAISLGVRGHLRTRSGRCTSCGHQLGGRTGHRCPECGN